MTELLLSERSTDLVKVVLTDELPLVDPMKQLREVFPNACHLSYARDERKPDNGSHFPDQSRINDPGQMIGDFVALVRGERLDEAELELVDSGLFSLHDEETAA